MPALVACLSPYSEETVRAMFKDRHPVELVFVPDPPAQEAVLNATHAAHLVIADKRHLHRIDRRVLENMRSCLLIQQAAVGFDSIDHRAAAEYGIPVANAAGYNREAVADWTILAILNLLRHASWGDRQMHAGWWGRTEMMGRQLGSLTVGIVGLGNVGRRVAELCRGLFAMPVIACDPYLDAETTSGRGAVKVTLDELLRRADFVSINCPLDEGTRGMIGAREFALMQPHAYFITTARGFIHDERALAEALRSKQIAGAGIDVWDKEPPPPDHPLLQFDNVIASPHTAGVTREARANMGRIAAEQLIMTLDGKRPPRIVNPQVWPAYAKRFEQTFGFAPERTD